MTQENKYKASNAGTAFDPKTGKLYIFTSESASVMIAWPKPMAWIKTRSRPFWVQFRPNIYIKRKDIQDRIRRLEFKADNEGQLTLPFFDPPKLSMADRTELSWLRWFATIPVEIRKLIRRFSTRQWHMLSFLARCEKPAMDLTQSNPALAYALASNWVYHRPAVNRPLRSARTLLKPCRNQRQILAWLGFPGTEAARKVLAKVIHQSIDIPTLFYLRQGMAYSSALKAMSHLQRLNAGVIRVLAVPELFELVSPAFLDEVAYCRKEDRHIKAAYILRDCASMFRMLNPDRRFPGPVFRLRHLMELHETLIDELNLARWSFQKIGFPHPPLKGSDIIVPITTSDELIEEGRIQQNCVATYLEWVARGPYVYIYRILWPERCTLAITKYGDKWFLSELKKAGNASVSPNTRKIVNDWLLSQRGE